MVTAPGKRPPGRPRSQASHDAILDATAGLIARNGYTATTIDEIAAAAGVGKQTIYRRWPTKADVVLEAAATETTLAVPVSHHGSYAADLRAFLSAGFTMASHPQTADLLRALMVEAQIRPEFGQRFRQTFLAPRRDAFAQITQRAAQRGDLPAHPAPAIVADIVFGTLWYRLLATHQDLDDQLIDELTHTLTSPSGDRTRRQRTADAR